MPIQHVLRLKCEEIKILTVISSTFLGREIFLRIKTIKGGGNTYASEIANKEESSA
jgi:hypothetical protein